VAIDFGTEAGDDLLSNINTTPLVDVMLVLLIIFLITVPVVTHSVPVTLPSERVQPTQTKPQTISITVDQAGDIFWNQTKLANAADLQTRLNAAAAQTPQPDVKIRGDAEAHYGGVGEVLLACEKAGIVKIGFITQPPAPGGG
jgi:biopolymer transport protein ExbD